MAAQTSSRANLQSIQLLRGIAALSVVYVHTRVTPNFGLFGVDIFFVISGFIIAMVTETQRNAAAFFVNRLCRIAPLYWLVTTGLVGVIWFAPQLVYSTTLNLPNYLKSLFFIPYFKESHLIQPFLNVGWTLNYEMFFYLGMTLSLVFFKKHHLWATVIIIDAAYVLLGRVSDDPLLNGFFGNSKVFEFVLGIVAFRLHARGWPTRLPASICLIGGVACLVTMAVTEVHQVQIDSLVICGLPSFILVLCSLRFEGLLQGQRVRAMTSVIGDASYAIYLTHIFTVELFRKVIAPRIALLGTQPWALALLCLFAAVLVGYLLHRWVDQPMQRYLKRQWVQRVVSSTR